MAQGWLMSTLTNKAILLGMVNFAAGIPTLALTMLGGSVADKYDKRKILIWTQFAQTALALILGILVYTGRIHVWHVVVVRVHFWESASRSKCRRLTRSFPSW